MWFRRRKTRQPVTPSRDIERDIDIIELFDDHVRDGKLDDHGRTLLLQEMARRGSSAARYRLGM